MRILYAIQGTGNGHISRARQLLPYLERHGDVDVLVSGTQSELPLERDIKYRLSGLGFVFGKRGGIDYAATLRQLQVPQFMRDVRALPVDNYELVISDFEPVSAWACQLHHHPCVAMSNQAAFLSPKTPRPQGGPQPAELVLRFYAPASDVVAFHFDRYDRFIHTPLVRAEVRALQPTDGGHVTVYLPAHDQRELTRRLTMIRGVRFEVFTKERVQAYTNQNVHVQTVDNQIFLKSLECCAGIISAAGFETCAEALYLGKKLFVIPMRGQFEQQCNAEALQRLGVRVWPEVDRGLVERIESWLSSDEAVQVDYPDETEIIVEEVVKRYK